MKRNSNVAGGGRRGRKHPESEVAEERRLGGCESGDEQRGGGRQECLRGFGQEGGMTGRQKVAEEKC